MTKSRVWAVFRPGGGRSPGRTPGREDGGILVAQGDIVELVKDLHDLLLTPLLARGQPLRSLQVLQPAQAPHLADHYLPSFRSWQAISVPQSIGARIVARSGSAYACQHARSARLSARFGFASLSARYARLRQAPLVRKSSRGVAWSVNRYRLGRRFVVRGRASPQRRKADKPAKRAC